MRDPIVFDDGVRLTDGIRVRIPADFRERIQAAAAKEGIALAEFARRAIAERLARQASASAPEQPSLQPTAPAAPAPAPEPPPSPTVPVAERPAPSKRTSTAWNT